MLIDIMGNNVLQKCRHTCVITKCFVVTQLFYDMHTKMLPVTGNSLMMFSKAKNKKQKKKQEAITDI